MKKAKKQIDWFLIIIPILAVFTISILLERDPLKSKIIVNNIRYFLNSQFSFLYILVGLFFLASTVYAAFSKIGQIRLGDPNDRPEYSNIRWGIMIFTSTMSADIIFYSLCEWMMYYQEPFIRQKGAPLEWSMTYSLFHWGPIAWSFYIMLAVAFAYMLFVTKNNHQKFSEACRPLFGCYINGIVGKIIDLVAVFALIAGTATTFSMSMPLLATVIGKLIGINQIKKISIVLMFVVVLIYLITSLIGMKAVSFLSNVCYIFLIMLLVYILLLSGSTNYIVGSGIQAIGNLAQNFIDMSTMVNSHGFTQNWTIYYWSYWIVWCVATPFFIGSISKGRTIKDVILHGYLWGVSGTYFTFIILSEFGISRQIHHVVSVTKMVTSGESYSYIITQLVSTLPCYQIVLALLAIVMIGLYSTVFESITMVISRYSYIRLAINEEPSRLIRSFWSIIFIILPIALLISNSNINNIQSVAIIAAFPTMLVMILIVISFYYEVSKYDTVL